MIANFKRKCLFFGFYLFSFFCWIIWKHEKNVGILNDFILLFCSFALPSFSHIIHFFVKIRNIVCLMENLYIFFFKMEYFKKKLILTSLILISLTSIFFFAELFVKQNFFIALIGLRKTYFSYPKYEKLNVQIIIF